MNNLIQAQRAAHAGEDETTNQMPAGCIYARFKR